MSLTNYITQSIVGSMLYYNWGFALHNQFGITASCQSEVWVAYPVIWDNASFNRYWSNSFMISSRIF